MIIRRLFLLAVAVVLVHSALLVGRRFALEALDETYGEVGVDEQGRVRHWQDHYGRFSRILSADEVESVGIREGDVPAVVRLTAGLPLKDRRAERERRIEKHTAAARMQMAFPFYERNAHLSLTLRGRAVQLHVGEVVRPNKDMFGQHAYPIENTKTIPVEGDFPHIDMQVPGTYDGRFVCVLNDEYWILDERGEFVQRQPLGHDVSLARLPSVFRPAGVPGARAFLLPGASFRPDRIPLRLIVARPGRDVIDRMIVLEPVAEEQRWLAAGFGAMAALRPVPLLISAMAWEEPTDPQRLLRDYWVDPYLAQGANVGWFVAALAVTATCCFVAFRWGRQRLASRLDRTFWLVAVCSLGPIGLLWMRMSIPWVAIEDGRAVNVESGTWDEPHRFGTEVFA